MINFIDTSIQGHVFIQDLDSGEVLVDKHNAINFENFSISMARTLANRPDGWIQEMVFGNGAATVTSSSQLHI